MPSSKSIPLLQGSEPAVAGYEETSGRGFDRHSVARNLAAGIGQVCDEIVIDGPTQGGYFPGQEFYPEGGDWVTRQSLVGQLTSLTAHPPQILETYRKTNGDTAALIAMNGNLYVWHRPASTGLFAASLTLLSLPAGISTVTSSAAFTQRIGTRVYIVSGSVDTGNPLMFLDIDSETLFSVASVAPMAAAPAVTLTNILIDGLNGMTPSAATESASWSTDLLTTPSSAAIFPPSPSWSTAFNGTFYDAWTTNSQGPDGNTLSVGGGNYPNDHAVYAGFNFFGNDVQFNAPGGGRASAPPGGGTFTDFGVWVCLDGQQGKGFALTHPFPNQAYTNEAGQNNCNRVAVGLVYYTSDTSGQQGVTITATAYTGGTVSNPSLVSGGSGYATPPTVTFAIPPLDSNGNPTGTRAMGTAVLGSGGTAGQVVSITITNPGFYPVGGSVAITFSGGGGTGANFTTTASAAGAAVSIPTLVPFPYVSSPTGGTQISVVFDFASAFPAGSTAQITGWGYRIDAGPNNKKGGNSPNITNVQMFLVPGDWSYQNVMGGGLTLTHSEPASTLFGKINGTRAIKDYGASNTTIFAGLNTLILPVSGSNVINYIAGGLSLVVGFRQADGTVTPGVQPVYYSNPVAFTSDNTAATVDISTIPVAIRSSFRYLYLLFTSDITNQSGGPATSFTLGAIQSAGNLSALALPGGVGFGGYQWVVTIGVGTPYYTSEVDSDASPPSVLTYATPTDAEALVTAPAVPGTDTPTFFQFWRAGGTSSTGFYYLVATVPASADIAYGTDQSTYGGGAVMGITSLSGGSGYGSPPSVTFAAPTGGGITATGVAVLTGGVVTAITITNPGFEYSAAPGITFGSGAASATAVISTPAGNPYIAWNHTTKVLTDNTPDSFLLGVPPLAFGKEQPPANPETLFEFAGRLGITVGSTLYLSWLLNSSAAAGLYWTTVNLGSQLDPFSAEKGVFFDIGLSGDNDPIQRCWLQGTELVVFKANSLYLVSGNTADDIAEARYEGANANVGLFARRAIATFDKSVWFLALDGLYYFDGSEVKTGPLAIQNDINPKIAGATPIAPAAYAGCQFLTADQRLLLLVPRPPGYTITPDTTPTVILVLDSRTTGWVRWTFGAVDLLTSTSTTSGTFGGLVSAAVFGSTSDTSDLVIATQDGQLALMSGYGGDKVTPASAAVPVVMAWLSKEYGQNDGGMGFFTDDLPQRLYSDVVVQEATAMQITVTGDNQQKFPFRATQALFPGKVTENFTRLSKALTRGRNVSVLLQIASYTQSRIRGYMLQTTQGRPRN